MLGGHALHDFVDRRAQAALLDALEVMQDEFFDDLEALNEGASFEDTRLADYLPRKYLPRYDLALARNLLVCLITVGWKLWSPDDQELACVGEELMLHALIQQAKAELEDDGETADVSVLYDVMFQDVDFELLFNPKDDGIEDDEGISESLGLTEIGLKDWFKPFHNVPYVHPLLKRPRLESYRPHNDAER